MNKCKFLGRIYYELNNYINSIKYYYKKLLIENYSLDGLNYLSTALWHVTSNGSNLNSNSSDRSLKSGQIINDNMYEKQLISLIHICLNIDKLSDITLCVIGEFIYLSVWLCVCLFDYLFD